MPRRNLLRLSKNKLSAADHDFVLVMKPNRLMNAPLVQKGPVATAQIDQPELADILQLDKRMHSGDFQQVQNESISRSSSHRRISLKGVVLAVFFEPGALLFWPIHQTVSTKNARATQSSGDLVEKSASPQLPAKS